MPDTVFVEGGNESPRRYTPTEIAIIQASLRAAKKASTRKKTSKGITPLNIEELQEAVEAYQWACSADKGGMFFRSNKERRRQLNRILELCAQKTSNEEVKQELDELDAITSQLLAGAAAHDRQALQCAVQFALTKIPSSGPDRSRARRQFIGALISIYESVTGCPATRRYRYHRREYGPFLDFVRAALAPFKADTSCEADIAAALALAKSN